MISIILHELHSTMTCQEQEQERDRNCVCDSIATVGDAEMILYGMFDTTYRMPCKLAMARLMARPTAIEKAVAALGA